MTFKSFLLTLPLLMGPVACQSDKPSGKALYSSSCVSCHNSNTRKPGAIGPALFDTKWSVLQLKVNSGTYPKGYVPKRTTHSMPVYKFTEDQLIDLLEYIGDGREHPCSEKQCLPPN